MLPALQRGGGLKIAQQRVLQDLLGVLPAAQIGVGQAQDAVAKVVQQPLRPAVDRLPGGGAGRAARSRAAARSSRAGRGGSSHVRQHVKAIPPVPKGGQARPVPPVQAVLHRTPRTSPAISAAERAASTEME